MAFGAHLRRGSRGERMYGKGSSVPHSTGIKEDRCGGKPEQQQHRTRGLIKVQRHLLALWLVTVCPASTVAK